MGRSTVNDKILRQTELAAAIRGLLDAIGEDTAREGLRDTPERVARMLEEITGGLHVDPASVLSVEFHEQYEGLVTVRDVPFYSLCEHHLLPFFGRAHVVYQPHNGVLTGLSKVARLVDVVARRPQLQERMTATIAETLKAVLHVEGVLVQIEAEHLCMAMRGIKKPGSTTVTTVAWGSLAAGTALHASVMAQLGRG